MRLPAWLGVGERRWKKSPDEEFRPAKTAWDWLQLLVVPLMLAAIALLFNASQTSRDRTREDRRVREDRALAREAREDATLESYFSRMTSLILDRHLNTENPPEVVQSVARSLTLAAVRRVNAQRKGEIVRFLYEAGLLSARGPIVRLEGADLRGVDLRGAGFNSPPTDTIGVNFDDADLRGARFDGAAVYNVSFFGTDLRGASFRRAGILTSLFFESDLTGAVFDDANIFEFVDLPTERGKSTRFISSCLTDASFVRTILQQTKFDDVEGRRVDFRGAWFEGVQADRTPLTDVRLDGAHGRPSGWGREGPIIRTSYEKRAASKPCVGLRLHS